MTLISGWFLRFFTGGFAKAITLFPFIILKEKKLRDDPVLMNHEKIHLRQQIELLVVFFYIWYLAEYIYRRANTQSHYNAYKAISFEREAYQNQKNQYYLEKRRSFGFLKYL